MKDQFTYTQLDASKADSFRILELQPGEKEAPIVCNLIHARLDTQPAYEAISYVWGSSEKPISIDCEGKRLCITQNFKDALIRVRLSDRPRRVWADSVCIDQDNLDEKGHQVQFMGKIYSNASRVLIFLGKDEEGHAPQAMSLVKDVSNMVAKTLLDCEQTYDSFPDLDPDDPWFQDDRWPAYGSLFSLPWFNRGWVLQEAALAQDAVVLWGEAECSWAQFIDTQMWFSQRAHTLHGRGYGILSMLRLLEISLGGHGMRLRPLMSADKGPGKKSLGFFMDSTRLLRLSDPVDRVFAFLAILDKISPTALNLKADYSKTPQSVFTEFAVAFLEATRDLNLLQWVTHTDESLELGTASWVPLWDLCEWIISEDTTSTGHQDSEAQFTLELGSDSPRLTVQALLFDTIRFASDVLHLWTVEDVAQLWQSIDERPCVYAFLQTLAWGWHHGAREAAMLQLAAYASYLTIGPPTTEQGMYTNFIKSMT